MESKDGEVTGSKETQGPTSLPLAWVDDGELAAHLAQPSLRDWREPVASVWNPGESPWDEKSFLTLPQECERLWLLHSTAQRTLSGSLCGESKPGCCGQSLMPTFRVFLCGVLRV